MVPPYLMVVLVQDGVIFAVIYLTETCLIRLLLCQEIFSMALA